MSVIIKDMEMPKCCRRCPIPHSLDVVWQYCGVLGKSFQNIDSIFENKPTYKHPDCPLVVSEK